MSPGTDTGIAAAEAAAAQLSTAAARAAAGGPPPELAKGAREFEAYMLKLMLQELRKGGQGDTLFKDSTSGGYRDLLDDALAKRAAEAGSFGLAHQLLAQWEDRR